MEAQEFTQELIKELTNLIDIKKLLQYNQILIDLSEEGAQVIVPEEGPSIIEKDCKSYDGNYEDIKFLARIVNAVRYFTDLDPSKHAKYRFGAGALPNDDEAYAELKKVVSDETYKKLDDAGYDIIKRTED